MQYFPATDTTGFTTSALYQLLQTLKQMETATCNRALELPIIGLCIAVLLVVTIVTVLIIFIRRNENRLKAKASRRQQKTTHCQILIQN